MPVKIRLQRRGRRKSPYYHIVIADVRAPRDGRFIEKIGIYNPMTKPATIELDRDKAFDWLMQGAQPTDTARAILRFKGVLYRKHLQRGVEKGVLTQEEADQRYQSWIADKEAKIAARRKASADEKAAFHKRVSGTPKPIVVKEVPVEEGGEAEAATEEAVEADGEAPEATAEEAAPVEEAAGEATDKPQADAEQAETAPEAESVDETAAESQEAEAGETEAEEPQAEEIADSGQTDMPQEEPATETVAEAVAESTEEEKGSEASDSSDEEE
jgi:small subunit ribosomal protein S16